MRGVDPLGEAAEPAARAVISGRGRVRLRRVVRAECRRLAAFHASREHANPATHRPGDAAFDTALGWRVPRFLCVPCASRRDREILVQPRGVAGRKALAVVSCGETAGVCDIEVELRPPGGPPSSPQTGR
jgi:hypothetical protein